MTLKAIIVKVPDFDSLIEELARDVNTTVNAIDQQYKKTYRTWQHKPDFKKTKAVITKRRIAGNTGIHKKVSKENPYQFVEKGTRVRYATMSPDFKAKTRPGLIVSRKGTGGVLFVNRNKPRPGIKKRDFTGQIRKREQPKFTRLVTKTFNDFSKKQGT
jgi:hypothetical protein